MNYQEGVSCDNPIPLKGRNKRNDGVPDGEEGIRLNKAEMNAIAERPLLFSTNLLGHSSRPADQVGPVRGTAHLNSKTQTTRRRSRNVSSVGHALISSLITQDFLFSANPTMGGSYHWSYSGECL